MDSNKQITCPKCQSKISIDEALTHQIEESLKNKFIKDFEKQRQEDREKMLKWKESLEVELKKKILSESAQEQRILVEELEEKKKQLQESKEFELELRKKQEALLEREKNLELEKQREIDEERKKIELRTSERMLEEYRFKEAEKDKVINDLKKALEDAQLKANQGSQQLQGEVQELELEQLLKSEFPYDQIEPVPKGLNGADVLQRVFDQSGRMGGIIIWESKRTKNWSEEWVQKLKDDCLKSKSDVAVLVSSALPSEIHNFGPKDGIYITNFENVLSVTKLIRMKILEVASAKRSSENQSEKMEMLYNYLRGNEFRQRVEAIVEAFSLMKMDLEKEKQLYTKLWAKREKQIQRVIDSTIGMHGELHGLMGGSLPELSSIELMEIETVETQSTMSANFNQSVIDDVVS